MTKKEGEGSSESSILFLEEMLKKSLFQKKESSQKFLFQKTF